MRFKPGIQKDFISRWLQLTPISLQYYENRTKVFRASPEDHYYCGPLMSVPIDAIEIVKVPEPGTYEIQNNRAKSDQIHFYENMFEVKLKCTF